MPEHFPTGREEDNHEIASLAFSRSLVRSDSEYGWEEGTATGYGNRLTRLPLPAICRRCEWRCLEMMTASCLSSLLFPNRCRPCRQDDDVYIGRWERSKSRGERVCV